MRHVGDITKLNGAELPVVDVITGGSPCQDLSIAGARAGLAGERSGLFMEQIRVVKEMRDADKRAGRSGWHVRPRYMVWENVPGAFSSNKGADFGAVLTEIIRIEEPEADDVLMPDGGWPHSGCILDERGRFSVCWRVHDAQFWGVPQRRKRIALVADFGGLSASEILFERSGMRWNSPESGEAREGSSRRVGAGASGAISFQERSGKPGGGKGILIQEEHTGALSTLNNQSVLFSAAFCPEESAKTRGIGYQEENAPSLRAGVVPATVLSFDPNAANYAGEVFEDTATTVTANHPMGVFPLEGNGSRPSHRGDGYGSDSDPSFTLNAVEHHAVAYGISAFDSNAMKSSNPHSGVYKAATSRTLDLNGGSPACNQGGMAVVQVLNDQGGAAMGVSEDVTASLRAEEHGHQPILYDVRITSDGTKNARAHCYPTETCRCLDQACDNPDSNHGGVAVIENRPQDSRVKISGDGIVQTLDARMGMGGGNVPMVMGPYTSTKASYHTKFHNDDIAETLVATDYKDPQTVTYGIDRAAFNQGRNAQFGMTITEDDSQPTLTARDPGAVGTSTVRRLTPLECERLQGFPDGWTDIGEWTDSKGKVHKTADSARYKALGNSIALPFWFWLLRRIAAQYERPATLGSLFDGIGGFPLCWERCNGPGTAVWASEIEEFPIAVTKYHFGGE